MALLIGFDPSGLPPKTVGAFDDLIAAIQTWAGRVDGINAEERLNALSGGLAGLSTVPTGSVFAWIVANAPNGYLLCDGSQVSRTTYVTLFTLVGTTYGAGNGASTFHLPDLRGRFVLGKAVSGTGSTFAGTGGAIDHTHTGPSHTHTGPSHTHTGPSHTHTISGNTSAAGNGASSHRHGSIVVDQNLDALTQTVMNYADPDSSHIHAAGSLVTAADGTGATSAGGTGATGAGGTGATGASNPPFLALNYIIKT